MVTNIQLLIDAKQYKKAEKRPMLVMYVLVIKPKTCMVLLFAYRCLLFACIRCINSWIKTLRHSVIIL